MRSRGGGYCDAAAVPVQTGRIDTIWLNALNGDRAPLSMSLSKEEEDLVLRANLSGSCQPEYIQTVLEELDMPFRSPNRPVMTRFHQTD
jgi:hypothetical protein